MKFPFFNAKKEEKSDDLSAYLKSIIRHALLLKRKEATKEPAIGTSKIGGNPHLPEGFEWPYYEGESYDGRFANRPLSFIAQIDLSKAAPFDKDGLLPKRGYLYFFYDIISQRWGFDPEDEGCAKVYYFDVSAEELLETPLPEELEDVASVPLSVISFKTIEELPGYEEFCELTDTDRFGEDFDWDGYDEAAEDAIELLDCSPDEVCKLLGYADLIQNSMLDECARLSLGLSCGTSDDYKNTSDADKAAVEADKLNWTLLAQFGTLSDEVMFGDCGCIYFYIRKEDLASCRFDRIWLCLQCG